ncbi:Arsenical pump membrane protein [Sulfurimonas denitrificans DSM 1251]|uniref:Arsenical pump membrane protein n=1 Tax=Sulfurimonas denitrificans (strain ATCC 33889 / DSM 1251) TaxID=326298 RepID=Q30TT7_SULDN|nr:arsenic transporter [Sulfurimonas denitrificans]ABB43594.1 Arsenical pump membrane protein [Sulfurimonas denitrificans DSM 1251]
MLLPFLIFLVTLILIIWQPRGLQIGTIAISGAIVALIFGVVNFNDVLSVFDIIWDATLAFIGIIIFSMILDEIGFFEYCALVMAKLSNGSGRAMFFYSIILGALVSALFANDGAALILTPILLAKMKILRLNTKTILAFLLAGGFISDSASLPFVFSNLTNIVTANYFNIGFGTFFANMIFPFFISTLISMLILWIVLRKDIPLHVDITLLKNPKDAIKHKGLFNFSWLFIALLLCSYFIGDTYHLPISLFALGGALIFLLIATFAKAVKPKEIIKDAPWQVVWFSLGLYIVVYGLKNAGLTNYLSEILLYLNTQSQLIAVVGTGFLAAILSAVMNNMPTIMIMDIALKDIANEAMIYANIIGCNLGPKMTPFGSLATLLWLHTLEKKGIKINYYSYTKFGLLVTPIVLLAVLLSLL